MKNVAYARGEVSQPAHRRALPLVLMLALLGAVLWREQMWSTQFEELRKTCHAKLGAGVVSSSSVDGPSRLRHDSGSSGAKLVGDVEDEGEEEEAEEYQVQDAPEPAPQPPVQVDLQQEVENEDGDATVEEPQAAPLPTPSQTPQPPASPSPAAAAVVVDPALPVVEVPGGSAPRLFSVPPAHIPDDLLSEFTLNGRIPVFEAYSDDQTQPGDPTKAKVVHYAKSEVDHYIGEARAGHGQYYGEVDIRLYNVLRRHPEIIQGKEVVILGSLVCWYESVALAFGASKVWTIEYGPRTTDDERLSIMTPEQYAANPRLFDLAFSISSFEHDGLGRCVVPAHDFRYDGNVIIALAAYRNRLLTNSPVPHAGTATPSVPWAISAQWQSQRRCCGQAAACCWRCPAEATA